MGTRKRHRSKDEWKSWVERWKASGLGGKAFAERNGLTFGSLYRWGRMFDAEPRSTPGFAEVRVREASPSTVSYGGVIEIVVRSGWVVRVTGAVDVAQLRAVLEAVESNPSTNAVAVPLAARPAACWPEVAGRGLLAAC